MHESRQRRNPKDSKAAAPESDKLEEALPGQAYYFYYNENKAPSAEVVLGLTRNNVIRYSDSTELNKFGARFKYSQYQKIIDNTHIAITSNITTVQMRRDLEPLLNTFAEYEICFGNRFHVKNHGHSPVSNGTVIGYNIKSSGF